MLMMVVMMMMMMVVMMVIVMVVTMVIVMVGMMAMIMMMLLMDDKDGKHDRGDCLCKVLYVAILVTVSVCTHFGKLFDDSDF